MNESNFWYSPEMNPAGLSLRVAQRVGIAYALPTPPTASLSEPAITFLFSPPRKAEATLAVEAASSEPIVKSSSCTRGARG